MSQNNKSHIYDTCYTKNKLDYLFILLFYLDTVLKFKNK